MPQKILAGRADDPLLKADLVLTKVDQVILAKEPNRTLAEAIGLGLKKSAIEIAIAYDTRCLTTGEPDELVMNAPEQVSREALEHGILIGRPGIGFPSAVHLERFAAPARLALTDDPRMASVGGAGMLTMVASPSQLAEALIRGSVMVRPPRSVQILLSGKIRPFVCVRDVALELIRRGLGDVTRAIDTEHSAPVVIEFAGPSARLLSVPERALLCSLAPQLGAAGAVFVSDDKTEVYLRDQRRSKAHRALVPDPGAPCDEVVTIDLAAVDPLLMDVDGSVRPVRELEGGRVGQVILGGDSGASLRDMLAAAALLKSKRVPAGLDLLIAAPSRQVLEVLAQSGALVDLIAAGARLIEPDHRITAGDLYPPPADGASIRTFDPNPGLAKEKRHIVASAETLAYAVANGQIGDPRSFKRPVRVTIPRTLPTDDVLVIRKSKAKGKGDAAPPEPTPMPKPPAPQPWDSELSLEVISERNSAEEPSALVLENLDDVRWAARAATAMSPHLRAVIAPHIPTSMVPLFSGLGVVVLIGDADTVQTLRKQKCLTVASPKSPTGPTLAVSAGSVKYELNWLALGAERDWTVAGTTITKATEG
ncbi:MAG: 3-isopropylmalate dehydratase [Polyangiaceae bacterium]|nr:3-isopropylmalate dehydratase [Polyangiaceae bacterium]